MPDNSSIKANSNNISSENTVTIDQKHGENGTLLNCPLEGHLFTNKNAIEFIKEDSDWEFPREKFVCINLI